MLEVWFETILEDLLEQALGREWRTRESSCNAIGELVQGKGVEKVCILTPFCFEKLRRRFLGGFRNGFLRAETRDGVGK